MNEIELDLGIIYLCWIGDRDGMVGSCFGFRGLNRRAYLGVAFMISFCSSMREMVSWVLFWEELGVMAVVWHCGQDLIPCWQGRRRSRVRGGRA